MLQIYANSMRHRDNFHVCMHGIPKPTTMCKVKCFFVAYPEKLNEGMEVQSLEGSNVTLHCPLVVSTLNSLSITWFRIINGHTTTVSDGSISDKDYSLTLFEVTVLKAGYYHCRAVSNNLSDGKFRILIGPQVRLSVTMKHGNKRERERERERERAVYSRY